MSRAVHADCSDGCRRTGDRRIVAANLDVCVAVRHTVDRLIAAADVQLSVLRIVEQQVFRARNSQLHVELPRRIRLIAGIVADRDVHNVNTAGQIFRIEDDFPGCRIIAVRDGCVIQLQHNTVCFHPAQSIRYRRTDFLRRLVDFAVRDRNHVGNCRRSCINTDTPHCSCRITDFVGNLNLRIIPAIRKFTWSNSCYFSGRFIITCSQDRLPNRHFQTCRIDTAHRIRNGRENRRRGTVSKHIRFRSKVRDHRRSSVKTESPFGTCRLIPGIV